MAGAVRLEYAISDRVLRDLARHAAAAPQKFKKTAVRVLRRSVRSGKSAMSREIRETINLKKKQVDRSISAGVKGGSNPVGYVRAYNRSTLLKEYMTPRQLISAIRAGRNRRSKGVSVKTHKKKGKMLYRGAFVAVMPGGHTSVFRRRYDTRLPIDKVYGPRLTAEFEKSLPAFTRRQLQQFSKEMVRIVTANVDIT